MEELKRIAEVEREAIKNITEFLTLVTKNLGPEKKQDALKLLDGFIVNYSFFVL
jgi:hypothetical protein